MSTQHLSAAKTLNPPLHTPFKSSILLLKPLNPFQLFPPKPHKPIIIKCQKPEHDRFDLRCFAGRSKSKPGGTSGGRIEGNAEVRKQARQNAKRKSKKLAESLFYRLKNPHKNYPDNFSEDELQMIGLGYDRMVRFMEKDDPNLKHPYDWYKYGEFGPYSWRGVVLGDPIRGRMSEECVTLYGEVRDQEEWEKIEQHEMAVEYQKRLDDMDKSVGLRYFWVFVRHPKWRVSELPWEQWTLVSEVAVEAGDQRLDKWTLMGRLGNKARASITQCAAWMRPDILYVKRPVYQCRFEPQNEFFSSMTPLLDPASEQDFLFELETDDGRVEICTYFGGLCKIVKINQKAFVDDVVNAFEKLSEEEKSRCLGFLLNNHPTLVLHPYTKEWKAKLEEMELGCDAPDDEDYFRKTENEVVDWIEDDGYDKTAGNEVLDGDYSTGGDEILDAEGNEVVNAEYSTAGNEVLDGDYRTEGDEVLNGDQDDEVVEDVSGGEEDDDTSPEDDPNYWDEEFKKALSSNEAMEKLMKKGMEITDKYYAKQMKDMEKQQTRSVFNDGDNSPLRDDSENVITEEWKSIASGLPRKKVTKSKIPPGIFMRAAVRPFTYRNLVKEIVLTRHALVEGEIGRKKPR